MNKRRLIIGSLLLVGAVAIWILWSRPQPGLVWKGKTWSSWVNESLRMDPESQRAQLGAVVRGMGTNIIPFVRAALRYHDPGWKVKLYGFVERQFRMKVHLRTALDIQSDASFLYALAAPSVQQELLGDWLQFVENGGWDEYRTACFAQANVRFGPEAFGPLKMALQSTNLYTRLFAISCLGRIAGQPKLVLPVLVGNLSNTNNLIRGEAALALRCLGEDAKEAVPVLLRRLEDPDPLVRVYCIKALAAVPSEAPAITNALSNMVSDTNRYVAGAAAQALKQIGLATAPKSGVK